MKRPSHNLRTGNVIRDPNGSMWIITDVQDFEDEKVKATVSAVSFDSENCSATQRLHDHERDEQCSCRYDFPGYDPDCERCNGTGRWKHQIKGWRQCKVLAPTVKDFILKGMKRTFDF